MPLFTCDLLINCRFIRILMTYLKYLILSANVRLSFKIIFKHCLYEEGGLYMTVKQPDTSWSGILWIGNINTR